MFNRLTFLLLFSFCLLQFSHAASPDRSNWTRPLYGGTWHLTLESAQEAAKRSGKYICIIMSSSDSSGAPEKFHETCLKKFKFQHFLETNFEVLFLDFPRKKTLHPEQQFYNEQLMSKLLKKNKTTYPTTLLVDQNGRQVMRSRGFKNAARYTGDLKKYARSLTKIGSDSLKKNYRTSAPRSSSSSCKAVTKSCKTVSTCSKVKVIKKSCGGAAK